jgi:hypothetical protein
VRCERSGDGSFAANPRRKEKLMETMLLSNPAPFFAAVRVDLFGGAIEQTQVDGIKSILEAWPEGTDARFVAYALATVFHETARTMEPIAE